MKRSAFAALIVVLLAASPASAVDQMPLVLQPTSQWRLDFADERCSLIRQFGDGEDAIRLEIDAYGPSFNYRVTLVGGLVPVSRAVPITELRVGYSPDPGERERFLLRAGTFEGKSAVSFRLGFRPMAGQTVEAFEGSVESVTLDFRNFQPIRLETGSMAAPFAAMHRCIDDLVASWGFDPVAHRSLSRPVQIVAAGEGRKILTPEPTSDFPGWAERRRKKATEIVSRDGMMVPVRLMIDADGKPTQCVVQAGYVDDGWRERICASVVRDIYSAALDANGRPVASFIQIDSN
ncbi:hypothetical protein [Croceibacterium aestuarii]|uniref:hypothetical protein n=1 Tax=Croceibacterium aestuarii TaxID=3064139 RepID=UPI00272E37DC|nr:hypothetical protein [Croceibacterium sp. D39]